jgi:hypothetical protein
MEAWRHYEAHVRVKVTGAQEPRFYGRTGTFLHFTEPHGHAAVALDAAPDEVLLHPEALSPLDPEVGLRVQLRHDVERYPHFVAKAGLTGTVVLVYPRFVGVKLDAFLGGCEEWANMLQWSDGTLDKDGDDIDPRILFWADCALGWA